MKTALYIIKFTCPNFLFFCTYRSLSKIRPWAMNLESTQRGGWAYFRETTVPLSANSGHKAFGIQSSCRGDGIRHESLAGGIPFGVYQSSKFMQLFPLRFQIMVMI